MNKSEMKLSAIMIDIAESILVRPVEETESGGVHAALLLAHVAWNQEVDFRKADTTQQYLELIKDIEKHEGESVRASLKSKDLEELIRELRDFKKRAYPEDKRFIVLCGINEKGNVQVGWR